MEGLEYQFRVYAMNSAGLSKGSEASKGAVAQNPVGKYREVQQGFEQVVEGLILG